MNNKYNKLFEKDAFRNIDPQKKEMLLEMLELMENKSSEQKLQIMLAYGMSMQTKGLQLTMQESQALMDALKENLSQQEQQKLDMMINMMNMFKSK